jgi:prevent-host-death family protein
MALTPSLYAEIGAFEAKTRLSELLRKVEQGERFTITVRGRAVADLVPAQSGAPALSGKKTAEEVEAACQRLLHPGIRGIPGETVLEWIREGRR